MTDAQTPAGGEKHAVRHLGWRPAPPLEPPPVCVWPPRPKAALRFFFGNPGYLLPRNVAYMALAILTWLYLTPDLARMATLEFDWIALVYARNLGLLILIAGGLHCLLYMRRAQGRRFKYDTRWLATGNKAFLFRDQVRDNVFWSLASGGTIWTAYEVATLWAYANGLLPYLDPAAHPVYFVLLLVAMSFWHGVHFYWTHRLLHWKPLYDMAHRLHHRNVNVGPWSGLAMHPIEHIVYFSGVLVYWLIPAHPVHAILHLQYVALVPSQGHAGFDEIAVGGGRTIKNASYFHYLHHRYFNCNYGPDSGGILPFDKWFGSYHDGSAEAHAAMTAGGRR